MYNDILKIGFITIHGYGLMIAIGVICALVLGDRRAGKKNLNPDILFNIGMIGLLAGFGGAKLLFCVVEIRAVIQTPQLIFSGGGFVVYGGIIGGIVGVLIYCRVKRIKFLPYFDLAAPSIAVAQGFGRIGCLLAGCCYGRETDSPLGIVFHHSDYAPNGVRLVPTQIISSVGDFLLALLLLWYAGREPKTGRVGGVYLILYGVGRFIIEFFRSDGRGSVGGLSTSQFIALLMTALGVILFFRGRRDAALD